MNKQDQLLQDLGTKATFFGLGMLAAKKLRPYAKYFIIAGTIATVIPEVMAVAGKVKCKCQGEQQPVEEATFVEVVPCCCEGEVGCECDCECEDETECDCECQSETDCGCSQTSEKPQA